MVIGLFNDSFPPVVDGVANVFINYAKAFVKGGDRCVAVTPYHPGQPEQYPFELRTFKSYHAPVRHEYRWGFGLLDQNFWNSVKDIPFDVLHSHSPFSCHLVARAIARRQRVPLITTFHSQYRRDFEAAIHSEPIVDQVIRYIVRQYNLADEVWTLNDAAVEVLREYGFHGDIFIMENACDFEPTEADPAVLKEIRERYRLPEAPLFSYIGQHTVQKNMPLILNAIQCLAKREKTFAMLFVGDGPYREEMIKIIQQAGLSDCVKFAGIERDRMLIQKIMSASEAVMMPSYYDTSSLVPREAASCRTPAIFSKGAVTAEGIVDRRDGFLTEPTPERLADVMQEIIEKPELRKAVGEGAFASLYRPWSRAAAEARERYQYVIEKNAVSRRMG